jgi:hypothetical protein
MSYVGLHGRPEITHPPTGVDISSCKSFTHSSQCVAMLVHVVCCASRHEFKVFDSFCIPRYRCHILSSTLTNWTFWLSEHLDVRTAFQLVFVWGVKSCTHGPSPVTTVSSNFFLFFTVEYVEEQSRNVDFCAVFQTLLLSVRSLCRSRVSCGQNFVQFEWKIPVHHRVFMAVAVGVVYITLCLHVTGIYDSMMTAMKFNSPHICLFRDRSHPC